MCEHWRAKWLNHIFFIKGWKLHKPPIVQIQLRHWVWRCALSSYQARYSDCKWCLKRVSFNCKINFSRSLRQESRASQLEFSAKDYRQFVSSRRRLASTIGMLHLQFVWLHLQDALLTFVFVHRHWPKNLTASIVNIVRVQLASMTLNTISTQLTQW